MIFLEFNSIGFLLCFLPAFFVLYGLVPKRYRNVTILLGSLFFYAMGNLWNLPILMASVLANFWLGGRLVQGSGRKGSGRKIQKNKFLLLAGIAGNVGLLAFFKVARGGAYLPLGISFYTFQMLSYLIDVYREEEKSENSFLRFAVYVCMFPRLLSGPIVRYGEVRENLRKRKFHAENLQQGLKVFTVGLAAKVLLADRIGLLWRQVQVTGFESISVPLAWMAAVAYSLKIYFDFYGYSLMAVGLGRMLGFELPENFREPYMARTVRDFYRRWHITLGRWFCRYVYIPMGGSRRGEWRTAVNLLAVWLLTALWHGFSANFLIWGMLIWVLIVAERQGKALGMDGLFRKKGFRILPHLYLITVIPVTWMCFAITDVSQLQIYLGRMFGVLEGVRVSAGDWLKALETYWYLFGIGFLACTSAVKRLFFRWKDSVGGMLVLAVLFWLCIRRMTLEGQNPFLYFSF